MRAHPITSPIVALAVVAALTLVACGDGSPDAALRDRETQTDRQASRQSSGAEKTSVAAAAAGIGRFATWRAMRHVRRLASGIGVRVRATGGEYRGSRYIRRTFRSYGYNVKVQKFEVDGGTSRNVVAWWPEARRYPMVVGGHMDTVSGSPGANDNASGVAITLEVARLFAGKPQARFVRFVAFGSEEYGSNGVHHVGSQTYVNRLGREGRNRSAGMVSVDMVADGRPLIVGTAGIWSEIVARTLYRKLRRANFSVRFATTCDCSDNGPFERARIPASFMWSGSEPNYHDPSDTVPNMSRRDLKRSGRAVRLFVKAFDRELLARFRHS